MNGQRRTVQIETKLVQSGVRRDEVTGAISFPIYNSATFRHPAVGESTGFDYSRTKNPTRDTLEQAMAELEEGCRGFAFSTGMAAVTTVLMAFKPGDHIVLTADLYGGTYRVLKEVLEPLGIRGTFADTSDVTKVERAITDETVALFVENPTNPLMKVADIQQLADLTRAKGLLFIVDNTFLTPYLQQPLLLGADIVIHSATKYLAGHNDVLAGIVCKDDEWAERIGFCQNAVGAVLGAHDAWLVLRGLKTLAFRMERHQENALRIARWLSEHPQVTQVHYPGLPEHPGGSLLRRQARGAGGMLSFSVPSRAAAETVLENVRLFSFAESLGGVESLITYPMLQTHADIPRDELIRLGIDETLLRVSVGVEHCDDLIADLAQALERI